MNVYKPSIFNNWYTFSERRYLYNAHTGFFGRVSDEMYDLINNIGSCKDVEETSHFNLLVSKGIIIKEVINEQNLIQSKILSEQFGGNPYRFSFIISTTRKCNYKCRYCFEKTNNNLINMNQDTQKRTVEFIINVIKNNPNCKAIHITWFGGEPLINEECIRYISKELTKFCDKSNVNYSASMITNASLVNNKFTEMIDSLRIKSIQITFDGNMLEYCKYKGTTESNFIKAMEAVFLLSKETKINLRLNTDFNNYNSIKELVLMLLPRIRTENIEKQLVFYLAIIEDENTKEMFSSEYTDLNKDFLEFLYTHGLYSSIKGVLPQPRYISCDAMKKGNYVIDANGNLVKCEHYVGDDNRAAGTVCQGVFYNNNELKFMEQNPNIKCLQCSVFPICHGGCIQKRIDKNVYVNCNSFKKNLYNKLFYLSTILDEDK